MRSNANYDAIAACGFWGGKRGGVKAGRGLGRGRGRKGVKAVRGRGRSHVDVAVLTCH